MRPRSLWSTRISGLREKLESYSGLLKTELPLAAGICVVAGEVLALGGSPNINQGMLGFLTGFFISGSAMISNDYFDLDVDRVNHPDRPLPSGRVSVRELALLTTVFSIAGLMSAALLSSIAVLFAAVLLIVGLLYNWKFKEVGLPGNMMVSFSVAMTFVFGGVSTGQLENGVVWIFGMLAFLFDLAEEIAGGAMDLEGDKLRSVKSLAELKGRRFALRISAALLACFVMLTFLPFLLGWLGDIYLLLVAITDGAVSYFTYKLLKQGADEGRPRIRQLYVTLMIFVVVFIISRLFLK